MKNIDKLFEERKNLLQGKQTAALDSQTTSLALQNKREAQTEKKPSQIQGQASKTRYQEIMNYLGNIEEEFSQMAISNRSHMPASPSVKGDKSIDRAANSVLGDDSMLYGGS